MKECSYCHHCYEDSFDVCSLDNNPLSYSIACNVVISGRYILEQRLGKGGMGIVFKARHKFLKSLHAIKVILPDLVERDAHMLARFNQEAVLAASIDHPNVIRVTDFGVEDEKMPFLVMEYVNGDPLSAFLVPDKPLPIERAFEYFQPIALGVAEAHHKGIIHRDLKPQNIIVQKDLPLRKAVKVLDFGLAKIKSIDSDASLIQAQTMGVLGSPIYMSPEQWENDKVDHSTDIYGMGVILFQMLAGVLPFQGDSIPSIMYSHLLVPAPTFASLGINVPPLIEAVVLKALQKKREDRHASVDVMLEELEMAMAQSGFQVAHTTNPSFSLKSFERNRTESMPSVSPTAPNPPFGETVPLTADQKDKLFSYFDAAANPTIVGGDQQLTQEFLQAQDRAEEAKEKALEADKLVQEFAQAQKQAEDAQQRALQAKERIEAEIRQRIEAEMQDRLALEQQERQKAEAQRLAEEAAARQKAEERANALAQAALEAQQLAEQERRSREKEVHQRELEESVRRQAEIAARQLSEQVAAAQVKYEEARRQAQEEAELRRIAEAKRQKIENDLQSVAQQEAELRRQAEAEAQRQIQQQASRFEQEAISAQRRVEEARYQAEIEAQKREQAEAAQRRAEEEARRLAEEMIEVQRNMEEIKLHQTADAQKSPPTISSAGFQSFDHPAETVQSGYNLSQPTIQASHRTHQTSQNLLSTTAQTNPKSSLSMMLIGLGAFLLIAVAGGGYGLYRMFVATPQVTSDANKKPSETPAPKIGRIAEKMVLISGGSFQMGRDDVPQDDAYWKSQYPAHEVKVEAFYIDKTEVSNAEYAEFIKATNYQSPKDWNGSKPPQGKEKFPATNISLSDANAYAAWISKKENRFCRVPTEDEWEFAARNGSQQTDFPWGSDWRENTANVGTKNPVEVGTSKDETAAGVKDMLGNVIEWTSTKYSVYPGSKDKLSYEGVKYVVRASSFDEDQSKMTTPKWLLTRRQPISESLTDPRLGFRLACQP